MSQLPHRHSQTSPVGLWLDVGRDRVPATGWVHAVLRLVPGSPPAAPPESGLLFPVCPQAGARGRGSLATSSVLCLGPSTRPGLS